MEFKNTVTIRRPAEDVFAFLADFENVPRWNHARLCPVKWWRFRSAILAPHAI